MDHYLHFTMEEVSQPGKFTNRRLRWSPCFPLKEFTLCKTHRTLAKVESFEIIDVAPFFLYVYKNGNFIDLTQNDQGSRLSCVIFIA